MSWTRTGTRDSRIAADRRVGIALPEPAARARPESPPLPRLPPPAGPRIGPARPFFPRRARAAAARPHPRPGRPGRARAGRRGKGRGGPAAGDIQATDPPAGRIEQGRHCG